MYCHAFYIWSYKSYKTTFLSRPTTSLCTNFGEQNVECVSLGHFVFPSSSRHTSAQEWCEHLVHGRDFLSCSLSQVLTRACPEGRRRFPGVGTCPGVCPRARPVFRVCLVFHIQDVSRIPGRVPCPRVCLRACPGACPGACPVSHIPGCILGRVPGCVPCPVSHIPGRVSCPGACPVFHIPGCVPGRVSYPGACPRLCPWVCPVSPVGDAGMPRGPCPGVSPAPVGVAGAGPAPR